MSYMRILKQYTEFTDVQTQISARVISWLIWAEQVYLFIVSVVTIWALFLLPELPCSLRLVTDWEGQSANLFRVQGVLLNSAPKFPLQALCSLSCFDVVRCLWAYMFRIYSPQQNIFSSSSNLVNFHVICMLSEFAFCSDGIIPSFKSSSSFSVWKASA